MFATFILVLFYRYDRVTAFLWIPYPGILLGEGRQLASVCLQIFLWLRNTNTDVTGELVTIDVASLTRPVNFVEKFMTALGSLLGVMASFLGPLFHG
jgi:hypothetical protein